MRTVHLLLLAAFTTLAPMAAPAQTLPPGSLVRLSVEGERGTQRGNLVRVTADSVIVTSWEGNSLRYPRSRVKRVEVGTREGETENEAVGIVLGGASGLLAGAYFGAAATSGFKSLAAGVGGGIAGGFLGAVIGGGIGHIMTPLHWEDVELEPSVGIRTRGLAMHLAF